jgi:hypothetical protein
MTFREFWPLYLKAHRLPGTRALHYFATILGISASIEAIANLQPLIFVIGVPLSYCVAIASHRLIEGNRPMIRVNAAWGAVADLRMCWLAIAGGLDAEFAKHGVDSPERIAADAVVDLRTRLFGGLAWRHTLTVASVSGVIVTATELRELVEPAQHPHYPIIQLGVPIVTFGAALLAAFRAELVGRQALAATSTAGSYAAPLLSRTGTSLQRACALLLVFGSAAFVLAELAEHGI